jgi:hypothetical protein
MYHCTLLQSINGTVIFYTSLIESTTHLQIATRLRKSGAINLLPHMFYAMDKGTFNFNPLIILTYITNKLTHFYRQQE